MITLLSYSSTPTELPHAIIYFLPQTSAYPTFTLHAVTTSIQLKGNVGELTRCYCLHLESISFYGHSSQNVSANCSKATNPIPYLAPSLAVSTAQKYQGTLGRLF